MSLSAIDADFELLCDAAKEASDIAMHYFRRASLHVEFKENDSPVSEGDYAVDKFLRENLRAVRPDYGWLSEETADENPTDRMSRQHTFIVDPIDGTRAYVSGRNTWCISIAIVENGRPVAGILACPALGETFAAKVSDSPHLYADGQDAHAVIGGRGKLVTQLSKTLPEMHIEESGYVPSLAYRIAMVADGRLQGTFIRKHAHEWDLAAADLIATNAGVQLVDKSGAPVIYNRHNPKLDELVCAKPALIKPMLHVVREQSIR
ncbi:MAG: 3'(2'),5'-bisphosphate nucleotidase CysQ [Pseudomonadota bacterium]